MVKPKKNVELSISKNKTRTAVVRPSHKLKRPIVKKKLKTVRTKKPALTAIKSEDKSYENLATLEPMFGKELREEINEQVHTEIELEEKTTMLRVAKSIIISTILTILVFFIISVLTVTSWETSLPVLIVIWIITTLLAYLFQTN